MNLKNSHKSLPGSFLISGQWLKFPLFFLFVVFCYGNTGHAQNSEALKILEVNRNVPYDLIDYTKMLKTEKGASANEVFRNQSEFNSFVNAEISLDPAGNSDYWFLFQITADTFPVYLTLPLIQNFEIELFKIDAGEPVLLSKGGILTPVNQKYLNYATELFDLKITPQKTNTYLLKINRFLYKTFPAQVLTSKALFKQNLRNFILEGILLGIIICVILYHFLIYIRVREKEYLLLSFYMFFLVIQISGLTGLLNSMFYFENTRWNHILYNLIPSVSAFFSFWFSYVFLSISKKTHPKTTWIFITFQVIFVVSTIFAFLSIPVLERLTILVSGFAAIFLFIIGILRYRENFRPAREYLIAYVPTFFSIPYLLIYVSGNLSYSWFTHNNLLISIALQAILFSLAIAAKINLLKNENEKLLQEENIKLEEKVKHRTTELLTEKEKVENTLTELKATQSQLIQSEKMASLGELTAGIAHEIQNPLNFVNNFSEVNSELIDELAEEVANGNLEEVRAIAKDIKENEQKINHHGKRADAIVKGMLQHSRSSSGQKEPTDINALADEYLRLSYHGLRAKDKSFNADFKTEFDESLPKINVVPQDIGRVLLNLINNAFYAVSLKSSAADKNYKPAVTVSTKINSPSGGGKGEKTVQITVSDNGPGIPQNLVDKIFQPFFTTKPTGSGTGLGLSLSYDIVKAHGGEISVVSKENEGTEFIIQIPKN